MGDPWKPPQTLEDMVRALRDAVEKSEGNTGSMVAALGSFENRISAIDAAVRPAQVRTHAVRMAQENIDRTIEVAEDILIQFEIARRAEPTILKGPHEDLPRYLEAVDQLKGIIRFFSSNTNSKSSEGVLNHVNNLLTKAALMIEDEFRQLMGTHSKPIEPDCLFDCHGNPIHASKGVLEAVEEQPSESSTTYKNPALIPPRVLPLLQDIARQLVQDGNHQSCYRIYRDARVSALELSLQKLGIEKFNKYTVQRMQGEALKTKIDNWNQIMQIVVKVLLAGERENCDQIFDGIAFSKDQCFAELAGIGLKTLLSFGDAVAKSKRSPEKLFVLLDMYRVMHELQSEVEVIFQGRFCSEMRDAALNLAKNLTQTAIETLFDLEETIEKNMENVIHDENVHPLTFRVISCANSLYEYQSILKILLQPFETGSATESQLTIVTMGIFQALQNNLDGRSKQYKDSALSHIFLMNNIHCMVVSVRSRSDAKDILGDDWIQRHRRIVQQNANQYKKIAWGKTLSVPAVGGTGSSASDLRSTGVSRAMIKERFKSFNKQFEELHVMQSHWNIPDQELREYLRLAVAEVLLPAYRSFVNRFRNLVERGKNPHKYMKHSPEKVEQMLAEFFGGKKMVNKTSEN
ncbi:hypothetical protein EJB05_49992 [Eragrostis curvula]|uniref:Exocyst subunit Exo70 family protein n=1 Tax=Eragrostis curvula TaxID=38414 RepID=A0A5J9SZK3_9POAL|nr:hypothetical protein EJB05_49992 [Eragrostis curvula]